MKKQTIYLAIFPVLILLATLVIISLNIGRKDGGGPQEQATKSGFLKGGEIRFATSDFFARAEGLLQDWEPISNKEYTQVGKWMDGWETERKRTQGHDWTIIALKDPSIINEFCVDTGFFTGNYALNFSIQAANLNRTVDDQFPPRYAIMGIRASEEDLETMATLKTEEWEILVPMSPLKPGRPDTRRSYFTVNSNKTWTHLRLNIYPDGAIGRLRIYGTPFPDPDVANDLEKINMIQIENGGVVESYSNDHYANPSHIIKGDRALVLSDGWGTARRPDRPHFITFDDSGRPQIPGEEWAIVRCGKSLPISTVILDTLHCKGSIPYSFRVEGANVPKNVSAMNHTAWEIVLPEKRVFPHKEHIFRSELIKNQGPFTHVKLFLIPDGEITRFKLLGYLEEDLTREPSPPEPEPEPELKQSSDLSSPP